MIIQKIMTELPVEFIIPVLALSLIYLLWMTFQLIITRVRIKQFRIDFYATESTIRLQQGCNIENLPLISEIFDSSPKKLKQAYDEMIQTSTDFYQKKWIPSPDDFITVDSVIGKKTAGRINGFGFMYYSLLGILIFFATIFTGSILFDNPDAILACLYLSFLPLLLSLLFTILFIAEKLQISRIAENSIKSLNHAISQKLPVFSEYNGLAILVNQFLEYDRHMSDSVSELTTKIDNFVMGGLSDAISESIEVVLQESIAPSIERSTDAIITLSKDVIEKENAGMTDLALKFSTALSEQLAFQFEPMTQKIIDVANTLSDSKKYVDIASQILETYKENVLALNLQTSKTLEDYEASRAAFSGDIHTIAESFDQFNKSSSSYNENVTANQKQFEAAAITLKDSLDESNKTLQILLDGIFVEARNAVEQAHESQKMNETYLSVMKEQISTFTEQLAINNIEIFDGLSSAIADFSSKQSEQLIDQQNKVSSQSLIMMQSMETAAKNIESSSDKIKSSLDELEAARIREIENAKNQKKGFFGRK
ncbi:MAG: hypothetical protein ACYCYI_14450 [Saccharofermentanales bacterium]